MILYYITDRTAFPGSESVRRQALLKKIAETACCGVDFIQLREKDLSSRDLESLTHAAVQAVRRNSAKTRLLVNSRSDVAIACAADGVHLRSDDISTREVRTIWRHSVDDSFSPIVTVSCHTIDDVARAAAEGANYALFAPVFGKKDEPQAQPAGLDELHLACEQKIPVLALGGVTVDNARLCLDAGAVGIAAIRLFQDNDVAEVVGRLRI